MLKNPYRKRKNVLFFFVTFLTAFSILLGGFVVGSPALADDDQQGSPDQESPVTSEITPEPEQVTEGEEGEEEDEEEQEKEDEEEEKEKEETEPTETEVEDEDEQEKEAEDEQEKEAEDEQETEAEDEQEKEAEDEQETEAEDEQDDDGDGVSDDDEEELDREVQVVQEENRVKIESERKTDTNKDEFKTEIEEIEGLRIKYEYKSEAENEESEVELVIQFIQLIEYIDTGNDGLDEGDIKATYPLEGFTYEVNDLETSTDNEILHEIIATSTDGVFVVRVLAPEGFAVLDGIQIEPTTLKIDIEIHNFPYTEESSQIALDTKIETSASDFDLLMEGEELVGVSTTIGGYSAEFTWVSTVIVDDEDYPVGVEIFEEESSEESLELKLFLLYPHGEHIVHDPKLGTPLNSLSYAQGIQVVVPRLVVPEKLKGIIPPISRGYIFFGSLLATVFVVSVPVILRKRKD
jgi:outer membrane biosynthesis protein TonB